jgi:hypothetical protein
MAHAHKSIFARHADKRGIARRMHDGRFITITQKAMHTANPDKAVQIVLDSSYHLPSFDIKNGKIKIDTQEDNSGQFKSGNETTNQTFQNDVFASEAEYDKSVASVIARIKSGEVRPIEPDAE